MRAWPRILNNEMSLVTQPTEIASAFQILGEDLPHGPAGNMQERGFWETNSRLAQLTSHKATTVTTPGEAIITALRCCKQVRRGTQLWGRQPKVFMLSQQPRAGIPCQKLCVCKVHMEVKKHSAACSKAATLSLSLSGLCRAPALAENPNEK